MGAPMANSPWEDDEIVRANRRFHERPWWERSSGETIHDIIGDAMNGHFQPSEVAALAREKGWRDPLSTWKEGSPGIFAEDYWNFAMAIAWICWRSEDAAREVWPRWLEHHSFWRETRMTKPARDGTPALVMGCVPESYERSHATVSGLRGRLRGRKNPGMALKLPDPTISLDQGISDLLSRLRAGDVHAVCRRENIPREQWLALTHDGYHDGPQYVGTGGEYALDWEILILKSEILELWREMSPAYAALQPDQHDQVQEASANPLPKQDPNPAEPSSLVTEVAAVARDLKIKATMRLEEKITEIEEWFKGERRAPPRRTTIKAGLKLAGLTNPRRR